MSAALVGLVLDRYHGPSHLKLTLLALADSANSQTGECRPSYELIAGQTDVTRSTAIRNVRGLIESGVLELVEKGGFATDPDTCKQVWITNVYRVRAEVLQLEPHWRDGAKKRPKPSRRGSHSSTHATVRTGAHGSTDATVLEPVENSDHSSADATVCTSPVRPCTGSTGVTLTKTLEPSPEDLTQSQVVIGNRFAEIRERREIRETATSALLDHHLKKASS